MVGTPVKRTLSMSLRWEEITPASFCLFAGSICVGEVYRVQNPMEWWARGAGFCAHKSNGHASAKIARHALETAVMAYGDGEPTEQELVLLRQMLDKQRHVFDDETIARRMATKGWIGLSHGDWIILEPGAVWAQPKPLPPETTRIHIVKRSHDWMAFFEGNRGHWGCGATDHAALADLLIAHRDLANIDVVYDPQE